MNRRQRGLHLRIWSGLTVVLIVVFAAAMVSRERVSASADLIRHEAR